MAYKLKLPESAKVHPVFHVLFVYALPPGLTMEESDSPFPEAVLAMHEGKMDGSCAEWLILWKSQPVEEATWESETSIHTRFPSFSLEDKANLIEGDIVRNHVSGWDKPFKVYHCRPKTNK